jgi:hypothetical protein
VVFIFDTVARPFAKSSSPSAEPAASRAESRSRAAREASNNLTSHDLRATGATWMALRGDEGRATVLRAAELAPAGQVDQAVRDALEELLERAPPREHVPLAEATAWRGC